MDKSIQVNIDAVVADEESPLLCNKDDISSSKSNRKQFVFKSLFAIVLFCTLAYIGYSVASLTAAVNENKEKVVDTEEVHEWLYGCDECVVGQDNLQVQDNVYDVYTTCDNVVHYVANTLINNWDDVKATAYSVSGVKVKACLQNKLMDDKYVSCTPNPEKLTEDNTGALAHGWCPNWMNRNVQASNECGAACSDHYIYVSKGYFWNGLPVFNADNEYDAYYSAPCVAAALANYFSNWHCLRDDDVAKNIGIGFANWMRNYQGYGASMGECPTTCSLQ